MAKFVIRPATAGDCSDILRLIKVAGSAGSSRGGVGVLVPRRSPFLRLPTHSLARRRRSRRNSGNESPPRSPPFPELSVPGPHLIFRFSSFFLSASTQELAKYEYMEEQVMLTEKGNASVAGRGTSVWGTTFTDCSTVSVSPSCRSARRRFRRAPLLPLLSCRSA